MEIAIIGAGRMGTGIARACAAAGHEAVLVDQSLDAARAAARRLDDPRIQAAEAPRGDVVIEAVFEDLVLKRELLARVSRNLPDALIATNTSSFRVADLAPYVAQPERFVAMHFFFPAHKNPLLEIAAGPLTDPARLDAAEALGRQLGKTVIRTADSPGFAVNRFLLRWAAAALHLVDDGLAPEVAEASGAAAVDLPYGPYALLDMSGAAVCRHALETLHAAFGDAFAVPRCITDLEGPAGVRPGAVDDDAVRRIRAAMLETVQDLVDEGVASLDDIDTAARAGLAWPHGPSKWLRAN